MLLLAIFPPTERSPSGPGAPRRDKAARCGEATIEIDRWNATACRQLGNDLLKSDRPHPKSAQFVEEGFDLPHNNVIGTRNEAAGDGIENLTRRLMRATTSIEPADIEGRTELGVFFAMLACASERSSQCSGEKPFGSAWRSTITPAAVNETWSSSTSPSTGSYARAASSDLASMTCRLVDACATARTGERMRSN